MLLTPEQIKEAHRITSQKGGKNSRKNMSKEEARELARKAASAKWEKHRKQKQDSPGEQATG